MDHKSQAAVVTSYSLSVMAIEPVIKFIFPLILLSPCRPDHVSKTLHTDTTAATSKGNIAVWLPDNLNLSQFHTTVYRSLFHPYMYKIFEIKGSHRPFSMHLTMNDDSNCDVPGQAVSHCWSVRDCCMLVPPDYISAYPLELVWRVWVILLHTPRTWHLYK